MIKYEDIVAEVAAGRPIEDIGAEITAMLNKVMADQKEEEAKQKKEKELNSLAEVMRDAMVEYIKLAYPELAETMNRANLTVADVRASLDACTPIISFAKNLTSKRKETNPDKVIADFLIAMGL